VCSAGSNEPTVSYGAQSSATFETIKGNSLVLSYSVGNQARYCQLSRVLHYFVCCSIQFNKLKMIQYFFLEDDFNISFLDVILSSTFIHLFNKVEQYIW